MRSRLGLQWWMGVALAGACTTSPAGDGSSSGADDSPSTSVSESASTTASPDVGATESDPSDGPASSGGVDTTTVADDTTSTTAGTTTIADDTSEASSATSTETASTDDSTGEPVNQACVDGCAVELACQGTCECATNWASEAECIDWCDANLDEAALFSPFCRDAWEAISACFATLTCEAFHEYHNPTMFPYPCADEADALAFECDGQ